MSAIGMIETRGLLASIECADVMLKAADVQLLEKTRVGGGLVNVTVCGDVSAVRAAVDAGVASAAQFGPEALISHHVIPRPHEEMHLVVNTTPLVERDNNPASPTAETQPVSPEPVEPKSTESGEPPAEPSVEKELPVTLPTENLTKSILDKVVQSQGLEATLPALDDVRVVDLRALSREYPDFGLTGKEISSANKAQLLEELERQYREQK